MPDDPKPQPIPEPAAATPVPAAATPQAAPPVPAPAPAVAPAAPSQAPAKAHGAQPEPAAPVAPEAQKVEEPKAEPQPEPEKAPEPEKPAEAKQKSLLGDAGRKEEPKAEPKADAKAEAKTEPKAAAEPLKYEPLAAPEGVTIDAKQMDPYLAVFGKHQVPQEAVQELVNMVAAERVAQHRALMDNWSAMRETWREDFRKDPEIGGRRQETTLSRAGAVLERYGDVFGRDAENSLRDLLGVTALGDNVHMIRLFNWMANFTAEKGRVIAATSPRSPIPLSRAARRYAGSNVIGGNGAA